jgi:hypothetical protein
LMTLFIPRAELETGVRFAQQDAQLLIRPATIESKRYSLVTFTGQPKQ